MRRRVGQRAPRGKVLVIACDGERTEYDYFQNWKLVLGPSRISIRNLKVRSGGNPLHAVRASIKSARADRDYHEFWCICDVDGSSGEDVSRAVALAEEHGIKLVLSDRCFELFIALHFEKTARVLKSESEAIALVRRHVEEYGSRAKVAPFEILYPLTASAIANCRWLAKQGIAGASTKMDDIVSKFLDEATKAGVA